jgi:16S rRNA (uracil1498-N3)-methyltransferase
MQLPFFYLDDLILPDVQLDQATSRHILSVLRLKVGEEILLTDGKGKLSKAEILESGKKQCSVRIVQSDFFPRNERRVVIAISLIKNTTRFEWFLEKVTELGISSVIPLLCERTEKEKFRIERMRSICISAMLQSRQCWMPNLTMPVHFEDLIGSLPEADKRLIAHCGNRERRAITNIQGNRPIILIGPEGDFTTGEIELARSAHFDEVSLGETRLRTETAGIVAATLLQLLS